MSNDKTNKMTCAPSEDFDQSEHPPSPIRVFAVHSMGSQGPKVSSCRHQTGRMLRWAHMPICWFCHAATQIQNELHHDKTNKMSVRPAKTQISLGIRCALNR